MHNIWKETYLLCVCVCFPTVCLEASVAWHCMAVFPIDSGARACIWAGGMRKGAGVCMFVCMCMKGFEWTICQIWGKSLQHAGAAIFCPAREVKTIGEGTDLHGDSLLPNKDIEVLWIYSVRLFLAFPN